MIGAKGLANVAPNDGYQFDYQHVTTPEGKLPRGMIKEEVQENWQAVRSATFKVISCFYDLGCFQRWPRSQSHGIIDARWVIIRKVVGEM